MYEYIVESLEDINSTVTYVIDRLKNSSIMTKEDIEGCTFSFTSALCGSNDLLDEKLLKKGINKVYNNSTKYISKYDKVIKDCYNNIALDGAVFYINEGCSINELTSIPLGVDVKTSLVSMDEGKGFNLDLVNYMLMYKLTEDVIGVSRLKVKGVNYLHCFCVSLVCDTVLSFLILGSDTDGKLGLNTAVCNKAMLCGTNKTVLCKKVFKEDDVDCLYYKYINLFSLVSKRVLSLCMPEDVEDDVSLIIKESIVLRDNANLTKRKNYSVPTLVIGMEGEVTVFGDDDNISKLTKSI